jgi:carbamoyl-phosphate synthase large subunit
MPRVLVTGASGDSAQGVIRALRGAATPYFVASVCIHERNPGFLMSDVSAVAPPCRMEDTYIQFLTDFIKVNGIDVVIPTVDSELPLIARRRFDLEHNSGAHVIVGSHDAVLTCCDKDLTSRYLDGVGVDQPLILRGGVDEVRRYLEGGTAVIMKPRLGGGSKGIRVLGREDLLHNNWSSANAIYQRYEAYEKEFTAVVMKDGTSVVAVAVLERTLSAGRTTWCRRVRSAPYESMLATVISGLDLPYLNIQFGQIGNERQVFDLNPRFSGSTAVFAQVFNGPDLLIRCAISGAMPDVMLSSRYFESMRYLHDWIVDRSPDD